ncbi:efflux RND transporter periplasmic adaptor subunit [Rhodopila globiformis]|uniref:Efflux transporter periplasmic adaptor subunit n=1 Tax=Rhodopila globiformis TaxID=1071 RepID=A0A2S6NDI8_RHOGL|nr:HlyD family secretion protein [Rhodopila globiformis]PPQ32651.1 efflux transporter periplasmic adaptor subunit [Rhodopila globiformis]
MRRWSALPIRIAVTLVAVAIAGLIGWRLWVYYELSPWTRDARISADIVGVTPDVSELVSEILVRDNQTVKRGDVLFVIDQARFKLALRHAEGVVAARKATLDRAEQDLVRYESLAAGAISRQVVDEARTTQAGAQAGYDQALADRDLAQLNLDRTRVIASVNGIITNFDLRPGDYVTAGHPVTALVDTDTLRIDAYFEETRLSGIHPGDRVEIRLMGVPERLYGHVESISGGIADRSRQQTGHLLANVNPTFDWVRLAQRIPVRIKFDNVPAGIRLIPGRTATVTVIGSGS